MATNRQAIVPGFPLTVYVNETNTRDTIAATVYIDETVSTTTPFIPLPNQFNYDDGPVWACQSLRSEALVLLTAVKFYGAGGQAPTEQWRYDYDVGESFWPGAAPSSSKLLASLLTNAKFYGAGGQAPTKQWRYDYDVGETFWPGTSTSSKTLTPLLTGVNFYGAPGQAPTKQWRYDYDESSSWQPLLFNTNISTIIPSRTQPFFSPQWHYDYDVGETFWPSAPASSHTLTPLLTGVKFYGAPGQAPTKQWHYDYDVGNESFWPGAPTSSQTLTPLLTGVNFYGAPGQAPTKQWRYDYDEPSSWQSLWWLKGQTFGALPFRPSRWTFHLDVDTAWQPTIPFNLNVFPATPLRTQPFFSPQWRYDLNTGESSWTWQPLFSPLFLPKAVVITTNLIPHFIADVGTMMVRH